MGSSSNRVSGGGVQCSVIGRALYLLSKVNSGKSLQFLSHLSVVKWYNRVKKFYFVVCHQPTPSDAMKFGKTLRLRRRVLPNFIASLGVCW